MSIKRIAALVSLFMVLVFNSGFAGSEAKVNSYYKRFTLSNGDTISVRVFEDTTRAAQGQEEPEPFVVEGSLGIISPGIELAQMAKSLCEQTGRTVLIIEGLGYGRSSLASTPRELARIVEERRELLKQMEYPKYTLIGHSLGCDYLRQLVIQDPNMFSSLICIDITPLEAYKYGLLDGYSEYAKQVRAGLDSDPNSYEQYEGEFIIYPSYEAEADEYIALGKTGLYNVTVVDEIERIPQNLQEAAEYALPSEFPVLVISSTEMVEAMNGQEIDWIEEQRKTVQGANATFKVFDGIHNMPVENPEAVVQLMLEWITLGE